MGSRIPKSEEAQGIAWRLQYATVAWFGGEHGYVSMFARALGVSQGNVSDWFRTERRSLPSTRALARIQSLLHVATGWLLSGVVNKAECDYVTACRLKGGFKTTDRLADALAKRSKHILPAGIHRDLATHRLAAFIEAIEAYRIEPSSAFVCEVETLCEMGTTPGRDGRNHQLLLAIGALLEDDSDAGQLVVDLLTKRKAMREAEKCLAMEP